MIARDVATLDLDGDDPDVGPQDGEVGLAVALSVGECDVREQDGIVGQLVAQNRPDRLFGRRLEGRGLRKQARAHEGVSTGRG